MKSGLPEKYEGEAGTTRAFRTFGGGRSSCEEKLIGGAAMARLWLVVVKERTEAACLTGFVIHVRHSRHG